ncbi:MAG: efflux transporter outer membrane subunit [Steroidobacteraceae bacterium]
MSSKLTIALPLALALTGCSLGPAYHRPASPTVATWRARVPAASAVWPSANWWQGFDSPELDHLMQEAEHANDDLAAAIARVREADAEVTTASAPLLPSVDASFTGNRQEVYDLFSPSGGGVNSRSFTAELAASYELDFWGENRAVRSAALATEAANRFDRETVELTVMTSVGSAYFSVLALEDRLSIARANLASAQETLKDLEIDENVGTTTSLTVAQQASAVATLSAAIPPLRQSVQQSLDALAILVGKTPEHFQVQAKTLAGIAAPQPVAGMPSKLLERRPDVAEAEAQLVAANADIRAARAAFFPTINLTGSGGYESADLAHLIVPASRIFDLEGSITQPLFHGRQLLGQYRYSKARYEEMLADYRKAVISAFGNVENSLAAVRDTTDEQQRENQAVATAQRAYDLSQREFHAGVIDILTVLSTQSTLFTAEDARAQVELAHLQALVALFDALGGGWRR